MSFIVQRARVRARRSGYSFAPNSLRLVAGRTGFLSTVPVLNRPLRRLSGRSTAVTIAAIPLVVAAAVLLNILGPSALPHTEGRRTGLLPAPVAASQSAHGVPGFPAAIRLPSNNDQATPRLAAVLAADLWQAGNSVYQAQTIGNILAAPPPPSLSAAAASSGPTLSDLLRAQVRLAMAQLITQELTSPPSDATIAQARQAVADAQAQIAETQRMLDRNSAAAAATATAAAAAAAAATLPAPPAAAQPAAAVAAQEDVTSAQSALMLAEHPYSDEQIASAQTEFAVAQQALNDASSATAAIRANHTTTPVPATAATTPVGVLPAPVRSAGSADRLPLTLEPAKPLVPGPSQAPAASAQTPATEGQAPAASDAAALAARPRGGQPAGPSGPARAGTTKGTGQTASEDAAAITAPSAAAPGAPAAAATSGAQSAPSVLGSAAMAAPAADAAAPGEAAVAPAPGLATALIPAPIDPPAQAGLVAPLPATIAALQEQVDAAQAKLDRYTAPPDSTIVQQAEDDLSQAQQRLDLLITPQQQSTRSAAATANLSPATAVVTAAPAVATGTGTDSASDAAESLQSAQQRYAQATQFLQGLTVGPGQDTIQSAQAELQAAQHDYEALLARADASVAAQVDSDPRTALTRVSEFDGVFAAHPDLKPFTWPAHGPISSFFGPGHPLGIDIAQGLGGPVTAAASGVVSFSGGDGCCSYGYYIDVVHPGGYMTRYGHLLMPSFLRPGDGVSQGQIIGVSGSTGFSTGPHVHFEIRLNGVPLDPLKLIFGALPGPGLR